MINIPERSIRSEIRSCASIFEAQELCSGKQGFVWASAASATVVPQCLEITYRVRRSWLVYFKMFTGFWRLRYTSWPFSFGICSTYIYFVNGLVTVLPMNWGALTLGSTLYGDLCAKFTLREPDSVRTNSVRSRFGEVSTSWEQWLFMANSELKAELLWSDLSIMSEASICLSQDVNVSWSTTRSPCRAIATRRDISVAKL